MDEFEIIVIDYGLYYWNNLVEEAREILKFGIDEFTSMWKMIKRVVSKCDLLSLG